MLSSQERKLLNQIINNRGYHPQKQGKMTAGHFLRRAIGFKNYLEYGFDGLLEAGFVHNYALNYKVAIEQLGFKALFCWSGIPRRIEIKLSEDDQQKVYEAWKISENPMVREQAWAILRYRSGMGFHVLAKHCQHIDKTCLMSTLNLAADGQIDRAIECRHGRIPINLASEGIILLNNIINMRPNTAISKRAQFLLEVNGKRTGNYRAIDMAQKISGDGLIGCVFGSELAILLNSLPDDMVESLYRFANHPKHGRRIQILFGLRDGYKLAQIGKMISESRQIVNYLNILDKDMSFDDIVRHINRIFSECKYIEVESIAASLRNMGFGAAVKENNGKYVIIVKISHYPFGVIDMTTRHAVINSDDKAFCCIAKKIGITVSSK